MRSVFLPHKFPRLSQWFGDMILGVVVLGLLSLVMIPVPTALLDVLLATNIALAILVFLGALTARNTLAFSSFPTLLLLATFFRLTLNISTTRLILLQGDAGQMVEAFGAFVVQGNPLVGGVLFLLITVVQLVVIARGSERIAEVSARFSLDALPGKQLGIDAERKSGLLSAAETQQQRRRLEQENRFYGAMDDAMKFVQGDAIAGLVITVINFIGGLALGAGLEGRSVGDAVYLYGLLTVGDGLLAQIPALILSTSAGLLVTRVASEDEQGSLSRDIAAQLGASPTAFAVLGALLSLFALVPGLPFFPFMVLALCSFGESLRRSSLRSWFQADPEPSANQTQGVGSGLKIDSQQLSVEIGSLLPPILVEKASTDSSLDWQRRTGLSFLVRVVEEDTSMPSDMVRVSVDSHVFYQSRVVLVSSSALYELLRDALEQALIRALPQLLSTTVVQHMLQHLRRSDPNLVEELVPKRITLGELADLLRQLVRDGIIVHPLAELAETLRKTRGSVEERIAVIRRTLPHRIAYSLAREGLLNTLALDPEIEEVLMENAKSPLNEEARGLVVRQTRRYWDPLSPPVVLTRSELRYKVQEALTDHIPRLRVLSYDEIPSELKTRNLAVIGPSTLPQAEG